MSASHLEHRAVIAGVGRSAVGRVLKSHDLQLTAEACLGAVADAGLRISDIDGVTTFPGAGSERRALAGPGLREACQLLGLRPTWYQSGQETSGPLGAIVSACMAVASGLARHVLVYRTLTEGSVSRSGGRAQALTTGYGSTVATGERRWRVPYGAYSAANWYAPYATRHMFEFGTTREQLAQIAITARAHAAANPRALYTSPLTMEDYLSDKVISTPFVRYDCDVPCDGSVAFVVSSSAHGQTGARPPLRFEAIGIAAHSDESWWGDHLTRAARAAGQQMWSRTGLRPDDVDVLELYDGFSFFSLAWLEALSFCGLGESGALIEGGAAISRDGPLPLHTLGGQLSAGRLHGYGLLADACAQLWGTAGDAQITGAEVATVSGSFNNPTCLLLTT